MLSVSENFVWNRLRDGTLRGIKIGRSRKITHTDQRAHS